MLKKIAFLNSILTFTILGISTITHAQKDPVLGRWLSEEKDGKIEVYQEKNGKYFGKLIWLKEPKRNGRPKTDQNNAKENLRSRLVLGLVILENLAKDGDTYSGGTIYDPKKGKTYSCKMSLSDPKTLEIRGYIGVSLIGRTTRWSRAN